MILAALSTVVLGLALGWAATRRLPHRLPEPSLVLATGVAGAMVGAFVTHTALDTSGLIPVLAGASAVSAASVSLLVRPAGGPLRRSAAV
ncbi:MULTISPECIES: hypothetical protein [unclassified Streptomyces]|uniref:hypothetical protein n=1 Tax=unclassified Streptomyces TaxID=2593676 RepID=UPI0019038F68|nr:hypothetical protein [Streptomyces sp. HSG2]